jgi:hypothetical protein
MADGAVVPHQELELPDGQAEFENLIEMARLAHQLIFHRLVEELPRLRWQTFEVLASVGTDNRLAIFPAS